MDFLAGQNDIKIRFKLISSVWRYTLITKDIESLKIILNERNILFGTNYPCAKHPKNKLVNCQACIHEEEIINIFNDFRLILR